MPSSNSILAQLRIVISAQTAQLTKGIGTAQASLRRLEGSLRGAQSLLAGFGIGFGAFQIARGIESVIRTMADFEHEMSVVRAITGATGDQFAALEKNAIDLGRATQFTAKEVAELQVAYGRLGFSTKEILDATKGTLDLAIATGENLAGAADVAGSTLRGFELDASETVRVVDVMASSFNKSALSLENFRESMKFVAPVANAAGASIEEATALLAILADAGIRGSIAGTSLRKIFTDMTKDGRPLKERLEELGKRGITLADSFDEVGRTAQTSLLVLTKNIDKAAELTEAFRASGGEADKMARIIEDNLTGDVKKLTSAWEGLILAMSNTSIFREVTQFLTNIIQDFSGANDLINAIENLALALNADESDEVIKQNIEVLKDLRRELGKPLPAINLEEFLKGLKNADQVAERLASIMAEINSTLSAQEIRVNVFEGFVKSTKEFENFAKNTDAFKNFAKGFNDIDKAFAAFTKNSNNTNKVFQDFSKGFEEITKAAEAFKDEQYKGIFAAQVEIAERERLLKAMKDDGTEREKEIAPLEAEIKERRALIDFILQYVEGLEKEKANLKDSTGARVGLIQALEDEIKIKRELAAAATSTAEITRLNTEIKLAEKKLKVLKELSNPPAPPPVDIPVTFSFPSLEEFTQTGIDAITRIEEKALELQEAMEPLSDAIVNYIDNAGIAAEKIRNEFDKIAINIESFEGAVASAISGLARAFGEAAAGVGNFGDNIIKVLASFAAQVGEILIATGTAALVAQKSLISSPQVAIAAGIALVALAAAANASISAAHQKTFSGGGGSSGVGRTVNSGYNDNNLQDSLKIYITGESYVKGQDIWIAFKEAERNNGFRRNG